MIEEFERTVNAPSLPWIDGDKRDHLRFAASLCCMPGWVMEFGVAGGYTLQTIAECFPQEEVWGFDSFEGLPEDWVDSRGQVRCPKGSFSVPDWRALPLPKNTLLIPGRIEETLPKFVYQHLLGRPAFVHVDVDVYSAVGAVLVNLAPRLQLGTVIVFDELIGNDWNLHNEYRAVMDCLREHPNLSLRAVARSRGDADQTSTPQEQVTCLVSSV